MDGRPAPQNSVGRDGESLKVVVAQIGAREHYAVARALHREGMLAGLVTDWYAKSHIKWLGSWLAGRLARGVQSALMSRCEGIPDRVVRSFLIRSLYWRHLVRQSATQGRLYEAYAETDSAFATAVSRLKMPPHEVFFGYSYASLEVLELEKKRGVFTVLGQTDPGPAEYRLVAEEIARHPEIAEAAHPFPSVHFDRNRREWQLADMIVVNSEWSRDAIVSEGAAAEKIEVIPLCYEQEGKNVESLSNIPRTKSPLRILFLGQVNVRKGIHYLIEAARLLANEPVEFLIVGQPGIRPEALAAAPAKMRWLGAVPRGQVSAAYQQSDVFILPTLSDGFAITQLEALANRLPIITTPNCGRVVEEGKTGFIVPPGDARALADAIMRFVDDRDLATAMRPHCLESATRYTLDGFGQTLIKAIEKRRDNKFVHAL
jgi:glycosyltransferase involved in cell wall biosynthesis